MKKEDGRVNQLADAFYPHTSVSWFAWSPRVEHSLQRLWQAECCRAERPGRFVPYY